MSKSSFQINQNKIKKALTQLDDLTNDVIKIEWLENWLITNQESLAYASKSKSDNELINYFRLVSTEIKNTCKIKHYSSVIKSGINAIHQEDLYNATLIVKKPLYVTISNSIELSWDINNQYCIHMINSPHFMIDVSDFKEEVNFLLSLKKLDTTNRIKTTILQDAKEKDNLDQNSRR